MLHDGDPLRLGAQNGVAVPGGRGFAKLLQPGRPEGTGDLQEFGGQLPPECMILGAEIAKGCPVAILGLNGIDEFGEIAGKPDGIGWACGRNQRRVRMDVADDLRQLVAPGKDQPRQFQQPCGIGKRLCQIGGRRQRFLEITTVVVGLAEWTDHRQDGGTATEQVDEFRA